MYRLLFFAFILWGYYSYESRVAEVLLQDVRASGDWVPAPELKITKAECTRINFSFSRCEVSYSDRKTTGPERELYYTSLGSWGAINVKLLRSASNPAAVTTDFGVRDVGWRIFTFVLGIALLLLLVIASIAWRVYLAFLRPSRT